MTPDDRKEWEDCVERVRRWITPADCDGPARIAADAELKRLREAVELRTEQLMPESLDFSACTKLLMDTLLERLRRRAKEGK